MGDFKDLTNSFQNVGIQETRLDYHELRLEYPVLDLLPSNQAAIPYLRLPLNSTYRKQPDAAKYHLPLFGTDFVLRLPLKRESSSSSSSESDRGLEPVFEALMGIDDAPGQSLLQIATYTDSQDGIIYSFRLTVKHDGEPRNVIEIELNNLAWDAERNSCPNKPWLEMICQLLNRGSDRAYFHVHERLRDYRWYTQQIALEEWDTEPAFDVKRLLAQDLRVITGPKLSQIRMQPALEVDFEGIGEALFWLPCNHQQVLSIEKLRSMTVAQTIRFSCGSCGERVIQDENLRIACLFRERERRAKAHVRELAWQRLEGEFPPGMRHVNVPSNVLGQALNHALASAEVPFSVAPSVLQIPRSKTFPQVLHNLKLRLTSLDSTIGSSSEKLSESLLMLLAEAVGQTEADEPSDANIATPCEWIVFGRFWFTRAAQLASVPGYDGKDIVALFGEEAIEDEEVIAARVAVDELEAMLRGTSLQ